MLNIDIGGGTTKLALVENGRVIATAAIHVGGRLQVTDDQGQIVRLDPAGQHHAAQAGFHWHKGDRAAPAELDKVAEYMADALGAAIRMRPLPPPLKALYLTEGAADVAVTLRWRGAQSHERIFGFAQGIVRGLPNTIAQNKPLYIMLDGDVAQTLGAILREELNVKSEILCIDGVVLWDF